MTDEEHTETEQEVHTVEREYPLGAPSTLFAVADQFDIEWSRFDEYDWGDDRTKTGDIK